MSSATTTQDHDEIRKWVEQRGGHPACVKGTRDTGPGCLLRIDFPGYSGRESLQPIDWDEFFRVFDDNDLAFLHEDQRDGNLSRFNKLVSSTASRGQ